MFDFSKCHPIELNDLVRVGDKYDGGYILAQRQIDKTETVLSFGISLNWSFEESFFSKKKVKIYSYDYSTKINLDKIYLADKNILDRVNRCLHSLAAVIYHLIQLKPVFAKNSFKRICLRSNFYNFFDEKQGKYFIPKFIGTHDEGIFICFDTIFKGLINTDNLSVFVKMDVEGAEYESLPHLMRYINKINGITVEFHNIMKNEKAFIKLLDDLLNEFYVVHTHGNNFSRLIENTTMPNILEITFINKKMIEGETALSKRHYPIKGLDFPCNAFKKDYVLEFPR